ncbi:sensor histidine kinase [Salinivirga cyanobacteriivorans]
MSKNIDQLRRNILDVSLIFAASLGAIAYLISLTRLLNDEFSVTYFLELLVILSISAIAVFRKKLTTKFKAAGFLLLILFFSLYDAYFFGIFSAARVYIVLIPFFAFLYFSFTRVIIFHAVTIAGFIMVGYLHHSAIQQLPASYDPDVYVLKIYPWIINAIHITIVAFIVLVIMRKFLGRYANILEELEKYKNHLESLVRLRTEELETTNEELKATNDELYEQKEELQITLKSLKQTQDQLVQSEKLASLGILTAGVAHEINNPVNYIYNGAVAIESYIKEEFPNASEYLNPYFEAVNTGIDRTVNIVKSLGRYTRSEKLPWASYDLHEVVEDCLTMLYNRYKNTVNIHRKFMDTDCILVGNEGQIHQVVMNVLLNALQSIEDKGDVHIETTNENNHVQLKILDTGKGIKKNDLKHIFDPFFTTKDPGEGTGLGLSISQKIVHEHGGEILCESEIKKGTMFVISLPVK